jgi:hypothetical protein
MKPLLLFCLCYLTTITLLSQNYAEVHLKVHEITENIIKEQKNYAEANRQFKELFTQYDYRFVKGLRAALLNRICNMQGTWEKDSSDIDFYLQKIASVWSPKSVVMNCGCADTSLLSVIEQKANLYYSIAVLNYDKELINLVDSLYKEDKRVRLTDVSREEFLRVDSINMVKLTKLTNRYGRFLGVRDLDFESMKNYETLITHQQSEMILEIWNDKILAGISDGDLDPERYADIINIAIFHRFKIINAKPAVDYSRYGNPTFQLYNQSFSYPVKDVEKADKLRSEIGVPPLKYHLEELGITYDVEAYKRWIESMGMQLIEE